MLTRLLPDQIADFWEIIKYGIEQSLPPIAGEHPDKMNRMLASLLSSKAQCWASYTKERAVNRFEGIILTKMLYDDVSDTKSLLLYCLYGYNSITEGSWPVALESILKYANSKGCTQVVAYSNIPRVIKIAEGLGGDTKYTFISFNVDELMRR